MKSGDKNRRMCERGGYGGKFVENHGVPGGLKRNYNSAAKPGR